MALDPRGDVNIGWQTAFFCIFKILSHCEISANSRAGQLERDREEKRWIHRLATVVPKGLNLMD